MTASGHDPLTLSVCVEAYNEAATLRAVVADLQTVLAPRVHTLEIIIVNDGSRDGTGTLADELARTQANVRVIHHARNLGMGASFRDGLAAARGAYFTDFPGDHENRAEELAALLDKRTRDTLVVTCYHDTRPRFRRVISRAYTALLNLLLGTRLQYFNGMVIYPTALLRSVPLRARGFLFHAEVLVRMLRAGQRVEYCLSQRQTRVAGSSSALKPRALWGALADVIRIVSGS
jgi:glycosyltransferase involved in cell wall biosynthesis